MHDFNAQLIRCTHANYIRWMHISPQRVDVRACDKAGIVEVCPAGDKEKDVEGRQWEQRVEVMRDSMIYFRNHPSILFWEAGNTVITPRTCSRWSNCAEAMGPERRPGHGHPRRQQHRRQHRPHPDRRIFWRDDRPGPADGSADQGPAKYSAPTAPNAATGRR